MRAKEFIIERKVPSVRDQIIDAVKKDGGDPSEYFVRFTTQDKLGFSDRQWFPKSFDVDHPDFDVEKINTRHDGGKRALWFYPLKLALEPTRSLFASTGPYVWLVRLKPNAWLQPVDPGDKKLQEPPKGKERVGMLRMGSVPAAIFFKHGYDLVGKYYDYAGSHKRHGQVKGPPAPPPKKSMWQKIKDKVFTEESEGLSYLDWLKQKKQQKKQALKVGYRGVSKAELDQILKTKHPLPSTDLMPFDNVIIELGITDDLGEEEYSNMSQEDIESWVQGVVPWYNGSLASVKGGVNYTTDELFAESYGNNDYIIKLNVKGPSAKFTDDYAFAKSYKNVDVVAYKKIGTNKWVPV